MTIYFALQAGFLRLLACLIRLGLVAATPSGVFDFALVYR
jgi:hypothetical protein